MGCGGRGIERGSVFETGLNDRLEAPINNGGRSPLCAESIRDEGWGGGKSEVIGFDPWNNAERVGVKKWWESMN